MALLLLTTTLVRSPGATAEGDVVLRSGPLTVSVQLDPFRITVAQDGQVVLATASAGRLPVGPTGPLSFAVGARVGVQPPLVSYGTFLEAPLAWFHATRATRQPDGSVRVHTTDPTRTFTLRLREAGPGIVDVRADLSDQHGVLATGASFLRQGDERYLGFGERSDRVDQTGRVVEQWNEEGPF